MLLLINFRHKIAYQRSNPINPVIIKTEFVVSSTAVMLASPASVVFLLPGLPQWQNKCSVKQYIESTKIKVCHLQQNLHTHWLINVS